MEEQLATNIVAAVNAELAKSMAKFVDESPMDSDKAQDEFLELVIYGNKVAEVADFLHKFYDSKTPVISCCLDPVMAERTMRKVFRYDFNERLKEALLACRAGYFVYRDGQWLNGHGDSFLISNVVLCGGPTALAVDMALRWRPVRSSKGLCVFFDVPCEVVKIQSRHSKWPHKLSRKCLIEPICFGSLYMPHCAALGDEDAA